MRRIVMIICILLLLIVITIPSFADYAIGYNPTDVSYLGASVTNLKYNINVWSPKAGNLKTVSNFNFSDPNHKNGFYKIDCAEYDGGKFITDGYNKIYFDYRYISSSNNLAVSNWIQLDFNNINVRNDQGYMYIDLSAYTFAGTMVGAHISYTDASGSHYENVPINKDNIHTKTIRMHHSISQADYNVKEIEVCYLVIDATDLVVKASTLNSISILFEVPIIPISQSFYDQLGPTNGHVNYSLYCSDLYVQSVSADTSYILNFLNNPSGSSQVILNSSDQNTKDLINRINQYNDMLSSIANNVNSPHYSGGLDKSWFDISAAQPYIGWIYNLPLVPYFIAVIATFAVGCTLIFGRN